MRQFQPVGMPRKLAKLSKVSFLPDKMPKMQLGFAVEDNVMIEFFDDMSRENWKRCLMQALSKEGTENWKRSYDASKADSTGS